MKRILWPTLLLAGLVTLASGVAMAENKAVAPKAANPVKVDANLAEYKLDYSMNLAVIGEMPSDPADQTGKFGLAWDDKYFYVACHITDEALNNDSEANWWEDDAVEIYFDMGLEKAEAYDDNDFQFAKRWDDAEAFETKGHGVDGVLHAVKTVAGGYDIEVGFPWTLLGLTPKDGAQFGFSIGADDDDGSNRELQTMWEGTDTNWNNASAFGVVTLK